jgi:hypothetical protein
MHIEDATEVLPNLFVGSGARALKLGSVKEDPIAVISANSRTEDAARRSGRST